MKTAQAQNIFHGGVLQDKRGFASDRAASGEPASDWGSSDRGPSKTKSHRSKSRSNPSRAKVPMTFHIDPILKSDIQRRAHINGNSASAEGHERGHAQRYSHGRGQANPPPTLAQVPGVNRVYAGD